MLYTLHHFIIFSIKLNIIVMEKQKIICNVAVKICIVICIALAVLAFCFYKEGAKASTILCCGAIVAWIGYVFDMRKQHIEDKANPLSLVNINDAISYVAKIQQGSKEEFVTKFCQQMYEHLLIIGIIHQIKDERIQESKWEITLYGEKIAKTL